MDIPQLLAAAETDVASNPDGELVLGWRIRLWDLMAQAYGEEGRFRRGVLAYVVARDTLPAWPGSAMAPEYREVPYRLLGWSRSRLLGELSDEQVQRRLQAHITNIHDIVYATGKLGFGTFCAAAAWSACYDVSGALEEEYFYRGWHESVWVDDQHLTITDREFEDWFLMDAHTVACAIASHGFIGSPTDTELRRQFWLRWLKERVPLVIDRPSEQVRQLLEGPVR
jgi:hypothetical protein